MKHGSENYTSSGEGMESDDNKEEEILFIHHRRLNVYYSYEQDNNIGRESYCMCSILVGEIFTSG